MSQTLYDWYCDLQRLIKKASESECKGAQERMMVKEWENAIQVMDDIEPGFKERYERRARLQDSFTPEQIDFICYEIGDWYIEWKDRLVIDLKEGTHRLGYAKEKLKSKICGD